VSGVTNSTNFPTTAGAFQTTLGRISLLRLTIHYIAHVTRHTVHALGKAQPPYHPILHILSGMIPLPCPWHGYPASILKFEPFSPSRQLITCCRWSFEAATALPRWASSPA
jgi:hypothetical protein